MMQHRRTNHPRARYHKQPFRREITMAFPVHSVVTQTVTPDAGFGTARIDPATEVVAGSYGTWRLVYEAGEQGISVGGRLRIRTDADTDWGVPQFVDPQAADYATISAPPGVSCSIQVGGPKSLTLRVHGRPLRSSEQIVLTLGDTSRGSAGSRAQTFLEERHNFLIEVDAEGQGQAVILSESPQLTIVGGDAQRIVLVAPSEVAVGQPFRLIVKAEDGWGNPASRFAAAVALSADGIDLPTADLHFAPRSDVSPLERGVLGIEGLVARTTGTLHVRATTAEKNLSASSNPIVSTESASEFQLQWADPHGGQIADSVRIGDFFRYARDIAGVQFVGYQRNERQRNI